MIKYRKPTGEKNNCRTKIPQVRREKMRNLVHNWKASLLKGNGTFCCDMREDRDCEQRYKQLLLLVGVKMRIFSA